MTLVPCVVVISHHFQRRRALVSGIVASGSSVGGVLHSIMLNQLFHGSAGFRTGVRASAGLNIGLFCLALSLMRTRYPPRKTVTEASTITFFRDVPYIVMVLGYVSYSLHSPICPQLASLVDSFSSLLIYSRSSFYNWTQ